MKLTERLPYIVIMSMAAGLLGLFAVDAWLRTDHPAAIAAAVLVLGCAGGAAHLGLGRGPARYRMPDWLRRYEVVPSKSGGCYVMCNRCDSCILPFTSRLTVVRLWTYTHLHTIAACEPRRLTDPESTRRLRPPRRRPPSPRKGD